MSLDRRRYARHKIHTPAYASVAGSSGGVIADANDRGILLQTVNPFHFLVLLTFASICWKPRHIGYLGARSVVRCRWSRGNRIHQPYGRSQSPAQAVLLVNALAAIDAGRAAVSVLHAVRPITSPVPESTPPLISDDRAYRVERRADPQRSIPRLSRSEERISAAQKNVTQRVPEDTDNAPQASRR